MAHKEQIWFVNAAKRSFPDSFRSAKVIEIGSLDINGTVRRIFAGCDYVGLDVAPGPGVDVVCQGQDFDAPANSFDTVISCEVMEHNPFWAETFRNMIRIAKPGGLVVMTCAAHGRPEHGTARTEPTASPLTVGLGWSYYRNLAAADFLAKIPIASEFSGWRFYRHFSSCDLYFIGFKAGSPAPKVAPRAMISINIRIVLQNLIRSRAWRHFMLFGIFGKKGAGNSIS